MDHLKHRNLILASKSPRRMELFRGLGLEFTVASREVDESFPQAMDPDKVAVFLAEKKALAFEASITKNDLIITSDTVVVVDGKILNKPATKAEAFEMLSTLSGTSHRVITGVCMRDKHKKISFDDLTQVYFRAMDETEITHYIDTFKPYDKAGAYGIQEWIGYIGVFKIIGSFYNVMGLPVHRIYEELKKWES